MSVLGVLVVALVTCVPGTWTQVIVDTVYGQVQGQEIPLHTGDSVNSFWAVPYAKPPLGTLRFAETEEPEPWDDIFIADSLGSACPQTSRLLWTTHPGWNNYDEDCLHLNIFTPDVAGSHPVLLYFHGGAYTGSGNIQYPGHFMASKGVVVVVANYRLGVMGFFSAGDNYKGNYGLYDQRQAMRFVRENIANFGGDPDLVTIYGQSAGASSTGLHLISPGSRGLFDQAICQSGSEMALWSINWPAQEPDNYGQQVAEKLDCPTEDADEMVDCLREVDFETLVFTNFTCTEGHFCQGFAPVIDGEGGFIPDYPNEFRKAGDWAEVPLMAGQTTEDGSFYTLGLVPEAGQGEFNRSEFHYYLRHNILGIWGPQFEDDVVEDAFHAFDFYYSPWPHTEDYDYRLAFNTMITDGGFGYTGDKQIKYQQTTQPDVWYYLLGFKSPNASNLVPEWMGVPHMGELPYVWGWPLLQLNPAVRQDCRIIFDIVDWTEEEDIDYTDFVLTAWSNFAKTGNPNLPDQLQPPFDNEQVDWPVFDMEEFKYYYMEEIVEQRSEYRQQNFAFYREYLAYVLDREMWYSKAEDDVNKGSKARRPGRVKPEGRLLGASMRLTLPCYRGYHFLKKQLWRSKGFLKEPSLYLTRLQKETQEQGVQFEDPVKWLEEEKPLILKKPEPEETVPIGRRTVIDESRTVYQFNQDTVLLAGEEQACLLTKSVPYHHLPQSVTDLIGAAKIDGQDELIQRYIMQAHIWDPIKRKIRIAQSPIPGWNRKRERGIPRARKIANLQQNLLRLCQSLQGKFPDLAASRRLTVDFDAVTTYSFLDDQTIQVKGHEEWMLSSDRPLTQFASTEDIDESVQKKLPDIFPLSPLIDLYPFYDPPEEESYKNITGWNRGATHVYPHTLLTYDHKAFETSKRNAKYLLHCFAHCLALAKEMYGMDTKVLPEPITTQCIGTNGENYNFVCFQLNTLDYSSTSGVKNFVWFDNDNLLFKRIVPKRAMLRNTKYEDYDPEVFKKFLALYVNGANLFNR